MTEPVKDPAGVNATDGLLGWMLQYMRPYRGRVALHGFEFVRLVTEVAAAGADHDVDRQRDYGPRRFDEAGAGRDSAFDQAAA